MSWTKFDPPSSRFHEFVNAGSGKWFNDVAYEDYQDDDFVKEGFEVWQKHAEREQANLDTNFFYDTLCYGLQHLKRLQTVAVYENL